MSDIETWLREGERVLDRTQTEAFDELMREMGGQDE